MSNQDIYSNEALPEGFTTLARLSKGKTGFVSDLRANSADVDRLKTMGLCCGRRVRVVKNGYAMIIETLNTRIGLSRALADHIVVQPAE